MRLCDEVSRTDLVQRRANKIGESRDAGERGILELHGQNRLLVQLNGSACMFTYNFTLLHGQITLSIV